MGIDRDQIEIIGIMVGLFIACAGKVWWDYRWQRNLIADFLADPERQTRQGGDDHKTS